MSAGRNPKETLDAIRRMVEEDDAREQAELDRIDAMSDEEARSHLKAMGGDLAKVDAFADKAYRMIHPENGAGARVVALPPPRRRVPRLVWLAAAAVLVAAAAYAARRPIARLFSHEEQVGPRNPTSHELAEDKRDQAVKACTAKQWEECDQLLADAYDLDPKGNEEPRVERMRWAINEAHLHGAQYPWFTKTMGPGLDAAGGGGGVTDKPGPR